MPTHRDIHPDFKNYLKLKDEQLIILYQELRNQILELYPDSNELLYHTHALTSVYSVTDKLSDSFCMIPIYSNHLNLGFNKGTLLHDPHQLLKGTGKLIRHIPITKLSDFTNPKATQLIQFAIDFAIHDMNRPVKIKGQTISKITTS